LDASQLDRWRAQWEAPQLKAPSTSRDMKIAMMLYTKLRIKPIPKGKARISAKE